ncbi:hypothetical protein ACFL6F_00410 [Planctomycetota bacterium]
MKKSKYFLMLIIGFALGMSVYWAISPTHIQNRYAGYFMYSGGEEECASLFSHIKKKAQEDEYLKMIREKPNYVRYTCSYTDQYNDMDGNVFMEWKKRDTTNQILMLTILVPRWRGEKSRQDPFLLLWEAAQKIDKNIRFE